MSYTQPILIVDDSELSVEMARDVLQECGYEVQSTTDPTQVLDILRSSRIEIVLLDMVMPEMSGLEVMAAITEQESTLGRQVMIFVLTGQADRSTAMAALKAGAFFYMTKPITRDGILPMLQRCVAQLQQARDPETMETSRDLRDRISQARKEPAAQDDTQLQQPDLPNTYSNPILLIGGEDSETGPVAVPLLMRGYHVLQCPRVERALVPFASHPVDIVLLNLHLMLEPATRLVEQIRRAALAVRRPLTLIPFVSPQQTTLKDSFLAAGATLCLERPVDETRLLEHIDWAARRAIEMG